MKLKFLTLSALTVFTIGSAHADTDWGLHAPSGESASFQVSYGSNYDQLFYFSLDKTSSLKAAAVNNFSQANIIYNYVDLYNFDTGAELGYFTFGATSTVAYFNNLAAGNYVYEVSGTNIGLQAGQVSFSSTVVNAVPEPETYALMLAGLGAIGFIARRRKTL